MNDDFYESKAMDAYAQGLIRKEQIEKYKEWLRKKNEKSIDK